MMVPLCMLCLVLLLSFYSPRGFPNLRLPDEISEENSANLNVESIGIGRRMSALLGIYLIAKNFAERNQAEFVSMNKMLFGF